MASTSLQSLQHSPLRRHRQLPPPESLLPSTFSPKPAASASHKLFIASSLSSPPSLTPSSSPIQPPAVSFDALHRHLSAQDFRLADEETRRLLISLAGEAAQKRGYVFFSEVQFIAEGDLRAIDSLWREHSGGRFGYSVQRRIWERKAMGDFTKFFLRVGWMKKLQGDTGVEQYGYRAFPDEFLWELKDETPEGHLPLTNALRGIQLLASILTHPAFQDDQPLPPLEGDAVVNEGAAEPNSKSVFKTDYSF